MFRKPAVASPDGLREPTLPHTFHFNEWHGVGLVCESQPSSVPTSSAPIRNLQESHPTRQGMGSFSSLHSRFSVLGSPFIV
jgi:hypothetical protein